MTENTMQNRNSKRQKIIHISLQFRNILAELKIKQILTNKIRVFTMNKSLNLLRNMTKLQENIS